jgi:hypothetical protein
MRPARRFERDDAEPEVLTALERLREALEPGQLRELLDRDDARHDGPDKQADAPETDDDADEPKAKTAKKGKAAAKIAEALNFRKSEGKGTCKIDVPYLDAVVTFPCDE